VAGPSLSEAAERFVSLEHFLKGSPSMPRPGEIRVSRAQSPPDEVYIEKGQHYGPYRVLRQIIMSARTSIRIIDPYVNSQTFDMVALAAPSVAVWIITDKIQEPDYATLIAKLRNEGRNLRLFCTTDFHDRYVCVDDAWWHSGHSLKDLGSKDSRLSRVVNQKTIQTFARRESEVLSTATEICP
jgi:hypothetical protein